MIWSLCIPLSVISNHLFNSSLFLSYFRFSSSVGRSYLFSFLNFLMCASRTNVILLICSMYLNKCRTGHRSFKNLINVKVRTVMCESWEQLLLVHGHKQPFGFLVEGHDHTVETGHLIGYFSRDVWVLQVLRAQAFTLEHRNTRVNAHLKYITD